jgi:hypothetical protein
MIDEHQTHRNGDGLQPAHPTSDHPVARTGPNAGDTYSGRLSVAKLSQRTR